MRSLEQRGYNPFVDGTADEYLKFIEPITEEQRQEAQIAVASAAIRCGWANGELVDVLGMLGLAER